MNGSSAGLKQFKDPLSFYDSTMEATYFLVGVEELMTLTMIILEKKPHDKTIMQFLASISNYLRGVKLVSRLCK
jgi:hypothetical protein